MKTNTIKKGFTLIELVVVMAIIAVLGSLTVSAIVIAKKTATLTSIKNDARTLNTALEAYRARYKTYPGLGWHAAYQCQGTGDTCDTGSSGLNGALVNVGKIVDAQFLRKAREKATGRYCTPDGQSYVLWMAESDSVFTDTFEWGDKTKCGTHTMPVNAYDFSL